MDCRSFAVAGYIVCAFVSISLLLLISSNTVAWCASEMATFWTVMVASFALDAIVVQPLFVGTVYMWRWMQSDDEIAADGNDAEDTSGIVHELHPIDGQWRYVGPVMASVPWDESEDTAGVIKMQMK